MLESNYNRSVKVMLDLPFATHWGLIEPLTRKKDRRSVYAKRFLLMIEKIRVSKKPILKILLSETECDTRSIPGKNLRNLMLLCQKSEISEIEILDLDHIHYFQLDQEEEWRIEMIKYLLNEKSEHPLDNDEKEWLEYLCTA